MKKIILSILTFCSIAGFAQQNLDLEAWTVKSTGSDSADYWINPLDVTGFGAPQNLFQETASVAQGTAAAHLTTVYWAAGSIFGLDTLPGVLMQQVAYTQTPASFSFAYKSNPMTGDYNVVAAQLTHWDTATNAQVVDGEAVFLTNTANNVWTPQVINFTYYTSNTPDTLTIVTAASANILFGDGSYGYAQIGSELWVDDFALNFTTGIASINPQADVSVYPNPAKHTVFVKSNAPNATLFIYDITGKVISTTTLNKGVNRVNLTGIPAGMYIYKVLTSNGQTSTGKLTVEK